MAFNEANAYLFFNKPCADLQNKSTALFALYFFMFKEFIQAVISDPSPRPNQQQITDKAYETDKIDSAWWHNDMQSTSNKKNWSDSLTRW